ncbi:hypothetical protein LTR39_001762 [Cryomyces antarcticus]|nr:hypothetical protein LTR39_001762 [Cryomyces antarcticus]
MSLVNYRTINIDLLDPESSANFDLSTLTPSVQPVSTSDVQTLAGQIRQLLRGGDTEGALRGALENAPYGADERGKEIHLATVTEILQSIRQADMSPLLQRIYRSPNGPETLDVLMKYLTNKQITPQATGGFSQIHARNVGGEGGGQAASVLLSWHEKVVEIAGAGCISRVMADRRTV